MTKITKKSYLMGIAVVAVVLAAAGYYITSGAAQTLTQNPQGRVIRGRVISTFGPVENARVKIPGEETYTLTDREGRYEIIVAHRPEQQLLVSAGNPAAVGHRSGRPPTRCHGGPPRRGRVSHRLANG